MTSFFLFKFFEKKKIINKIKNKEEKTIFVNFLQIKREQGLQQASSLGVGMTYIEKKKKKC